MMYVSKAFLVLGGSDSFRRIHPRGEFFKYFFAFGKFVLFLDFFWCFGDLVHDLHKKERDLLRLCATSFARTVAWWFYDCLFFLGLSSVRTLELSYWTFCKLFSSILDPLLEITADTRSLFLEIVLSCLLEIFLLGDVFHFSFVLLCCLDNISISIHAFPT